MRTGTSVRRIWSSGRPNWRFQLSFKLEPHMMQRHVRRLVLRTGAGMLPVLEVLASRSVQFSSGPSWKPDPLGLGRVVSWTGHRPMVFREDSNRPAVPYSGFYKLDSSLGQIKFLISDRIMTWSVRRLCSVSSYFTSRIQNGDATNIHWVAVKSRQCWYKLRGVSIATQWILVASQFRNRQVKERLIIHILCTDHVTIQSELRYWIGTTVVSLKLPECWW